MSEQTYNAMWNAEKASHIEPSRYVQLHMYNYNILVTRDEAIMFINLTIILLSNSHNFTYVLCS